MNDMNKKLKIKNISETKFNRNFSRAAEIRRIKETLVKRWQHVP